MTKSIETIVFYIRSRSSFNSGNVPDFRGLPVYHAWPKLPHHNHDEAIRWTQSGQASEEISFDPVEAANEFQAEVYHDISYRESWYSTKIPQAVIYLERGVDGKPCYLLVDLRVDGFIEASVEFSIQEGKFTTPMSFRFSGANYYLVPRAGTSYQEYAEKFAQSQKPKTSATTQVEIGVPFLGNYEQVYVYLGSRKCVEEPIDNHSHVGSYAGKTVHVYHSLGLSQLKYGDAKLIKNISVAKTKMKVKGLYDPKDQAEADFIRKSIQMFEAEEQDIQHWTKGTYGHTWGRYAKLTADEFIVLSSIY